MPANLDDIKHRLTRGIALQAELTAAWHAPQNDSDARIDAAVAAYEPGELEACIAAQHACNFKLWHVEDTARRKDVGPEIIADCKRRIDGLNQRRNDGMEQVDACLLTALDPLLPKDAPRRYNTESLGMAIDRLSILSLKIWHMDEQLMRSDVDADHIRACADKAAVLREQRNDLERSVLELIDEFAAGIKRPRLYFQFKMYNDPTLNPELYANT